MRFMTMVRFDESLPMGPPQPALFEAMGEFAAEGARNGTLVDQGGLLPSAAGAIVSLAISETVERISRVYFFDLLGASAGCLLLVPLLNYLGGPGGPNAVLAVAIMYAAAAGIWHSMANSVAGRAGSVILALALVGLVLYNGAHNILDVKYAKGQKLAGERFVRWNSFSRVAVGEERGSGVPVIFIDADASTGIASFDFDNLSARDRHDLLEQGPGLPYVLRPGAKTLVIGPGGGWDVARALAGGSRDITGVEINPIIDHCNQTAKTAVDLAVSLFGKRIL